MDTKKLRQKILDLAIHGKLVPQDPSDEPASVLLERIRAEKERLIAEGKIKCSRKSAKTTDMHHYEQDVPNGWCISTIGNVFTLQAGKNITANHISSSKNNKTAYPCFGGNGLRGYVNDFNRQGNYPIIGRQGALCGNINLAQGNFYATEHAVTVERYCNVDLMWVFYALIYLNLNQYATATAQPGLSVNVINEIPIAVPPLNEQLRISKQITTWFSIIDAIEQSKEDLQTAIKQAKSKILDLAIHGKLVSQDPNDEPASELLKRINPKAQITCDNEHSRKLPKGWYNTTLANMCNTTNGLWKGKKPPFVKVGVIRNANFTKYFTLDYSKIEYIDVEQRAFEKKHLLHGDLIVEKSGGSDKNPVGRAIFFDGEDGLFSFSNFTMCLRCKDQTTLMSKYLFYLLLCIYSRGDMVAMQTQTTGLHNLLVEKFMAMTFPLPPFAEQKRIVQKIEELFSLLDCIEKALQA